MIEIATYRLREGADPEAFAAVDARMQTEFFYQQPGLKRRTSGISDSGNWVAVTIWDDVASADAVAAKAAAASEWTPLLAAIDPLSIRSQRFYEL